MQNKEAITQLVTNFIFPFICFFALYIQLNGEASPGGGFQAGAIFASAIIGLRVTGIKMMQSYDNQNLLVKAAGCGVLIYALTGLLCMLMQKHYLDYNALYTIKTTGQVIGITSIELGVAITVAATMLLIYNKFVEIIYNSTS